MKRNLKLDWFFRFNDKVFFIFFDIEGRDSANQHKNDSDFKDSGKSQKISFDRHKAKDLADELGILGVNSSEFL